MVLGDHLLQQSLQLLKMSFNYLQRKVYILKITKINILSLLDRYEVETSFLNAGNIDDNRIAGIAGIAGPRVIVGDHSIGMSQFSSQKY